MTRTGTAFSVGPTAALILAAMAGLAFRLLFTRILSCPHRRLTFPQTERGAGEDDEPTVVCLDCGKRWEYCWREMRIGEEVTWL